MGKKRIAVLGEGKEAKEEKKIVKSGKQHGHLADVGAEALKEAKIIKEKEKKLESEVKKAMPASRQEVKPAKTRSKKYLQAKKEIDKNKFYPLSESIKLLKKISISHFNGSVDVHLNVNETGLKGTVEFPNPEKTAKKITQKTQFRTETKAPLIHFSIGKINDAEKNLEANFKTLIKAVGKRNIKKAVLAPTMGPGIKVDLATV